jgi:Zn-dependent protease/predicted transcriptional regulator
MTRHLKIGRLFGVEVRLHFSWFLIALLIVLSLAGRFREGHPEWGSSVVWSTATVTAIVFFVTLVLHELSHALVARARGLSVESITLFALGGVARIDKEAGDASTEFWIGIAGPLASLAIGGVCLSAASAMGWTPSIEAATPLLSFLVWLGYINVTLALFNLIPAFPMDGGRILRALLWRLKGDVLRATRWSTRVGEVVALGFILLGLWQFFAGAGFGALWLAIIGLFLLSVAAASQGQVELTESLRGMRVGDVMRRDCPVVDGRTNLQDFVEQQVLRSGDRCFVVTEKGSVAGLVTLHEVKAIPRPRWRYTTVDTVMLPLQRLHTVSPSSPVTESVEIMGRDDVQQLPVLDNGRLLGVISRGTVLQFLRTRAELQM